MSRSTLSKNEYRSITILSYFEHQNDCSITYEEYIENVEFSVLYLIVSNEYFDPVNIESPVGSVINDDYLHYYTPRFHHRYSLGVQKNTYEINAGGLFTEK